MRFPGISLRFPAPILLRAAEAVGVLFWACAVLCIPGNGPVFLRILRVVRLNEIRQRGKSVDRALCRVCSVIKAYEHRRQWVENRPFRIPAPLVPATPDGPRGVQDLPSRAHNTYRMLQYHYVHGMTIRRA
jgi:hypothetical protein